MKRILTASQMKSADTAAITKGVPSLVLMERAALSVVHELLHRKQEFDLTRCLIFCGTGNNAGDGVAIGRILKDYGYTPTLVMVGNPEKYSEAMAQQILAAKNRGIRMVDFAKLNPKTVYHATLMIDAIFGIGLTRDIKNDFETAIRLMNDQDTPVVAVDIPSGIHTDTGKVMGCACYCDLTVTFARAKRGMLLYPGAEYAGEVVVKEIGIPVEDMWDEAAPFNKEAPYNKDNEANTDWLYALEPQDLQLLIGRDESGNKGTFGKLLVIAGSKDIFGAAALSAEAALRTGAGMVKVFTEEANRAPLCARVPEVLLSVYKASGTVEIKNKLAADLKWCDGVLVGPGIGTDAVARLILEEVIKFAEADGHIPVVLDADALNILSEDYREKLSSLHFPAVFTPHMAEMSRLCGLTVSELKEDPVRYAEAFSREWGVTLVMKDARTIIADPVDVTYLNTRGNSALATAGSGDVLAGIIATLFMQQHQPALGVLLHALAGERAAEKTSRAGVVAGDLLTEIPALMPE